VNGHTVGTMNNLRSGDISFYLENHLWNFTTSGQSCGNFFFENR